MVAIIHSLRFILRQLASHFKRPLNLPLRPPSVSGPSICLAGHSLSQPVIPKLSGLIPTPASRPSALYNLASLSPAFRKIQPFHAPAITFPPVRPGVFEAESEADPFFARISRWSADVASALTPISQPLAGETSPLAGKIIHDLAASRFVMPVLAFDDV